MRLRLHDGYELLGVDDSLRRMKCSPTRTPDTLRRDHGWRFSTPPYNPSAHTSIGPLSASYSLLLEGEPLRLLWAFRALLRC